MASRRIAAIALAAAVCMVGLHLQDDHGASELVECGRNGCYATDSRAREPIHASALDPLAGSDTIHRAYSESGEIRGVNGGHVARGIRWQAAKRDRSHLRLERVGVHIGGSAMEKAVPVRSLSLSLPPPRSPREAGSIRQLHASRRSPNMPNRNRQRFWRVRLNGFLLFLFSSLSSFPHPLQPSLTFFPGGSCVTPVSIPSQAVFWDESEYDWKDHHSPRTEGDLRRIRQRSLKGQSKLAEYGVNVDSSWLGRTHKVSALPSRSSTGWNSRSPGFLTDSCLLRQFPTQGLDSLSTRPCGGVGTFVAATGGMQGEPYLLGGVSKAEHSSRDMLELSGVKVGTLNSRVRDENSGVDHPCLLNSPIVGADEK